MRFDFLSSLSKLGSSTNISERLSGILPLAISGLFIGSLIFLSFFQPYFAGVIVIVFCLYCFLRFLYSAVFILFLHNRLSVERNTDWLTRAKGLDDVYEYWRDLNWVETKLTSREKNSLVIHRRELEILKKSKQTPPFSSKIHHLLMITPTDLSLEKVEKGILNILSGKFPSERVMIIIILNQELNNLQGKLIDLQNKYRKNFLDFFICDPAGHFRNSEDASVNSMDKIKECFMRQNIEPEEVIVSPLKLDTKISPYHLSCLTYYYMVYPLRIQAGFQFFPSYAEEIWKKSGFVRIFNITSSFFQLVYASNPQKSVPFSDFSVSYRTLIDIGRSPFDLCRDSLAIFWEAFLYFDGVYTLVPVYFLLSRDFIESENTKLTFRKVYQQKKMQAAGICKLPILARAFLKASYIPVWKKIKYLFKMFDFYLFDTIWPIFFGFLAWLPVIMVWPGFSDMRLYYSASRIASLISILILMSVSVLIVLCLMFLSKRRIKVSLPKVIGYVLQWFLIPFLGIFLITLPSLSVQIQLLKKYFRKI